MSERKTSKTNLWKQTFIIKFKPFDKIENGENKLGNYLLQFLGIRFLLQLISRYITLYSGNNMYILSK